MVTLTTHHHLLSPPNENRLFFLGVVLNVAFILVEVIAGLLIHSLALLADAGHNLSDVLGLFIAWIAYHLWKKPPSENFTYGYKKSTILAPFLNALLLLVAVGVILREAIERLLHPIETEGLTILFVAGVGVLINGLTALLFYSRRKKDINMRGVFLHMMADTGVSLGVVFTGLILTLKPWYWLDPLVSMIIAMIILWGTWGLLRDSVSLSLDAVPKEIDKEAIQRYFSSLPEVHGFHDLHIWAMSSTETALTAHVVVEAGSHNNALVEKIHRDLKEKFHIPHATIQIEEAPQNGCCQNACP